MSSSIDTENCEICGVKLNFFFNSDDFYILRCKNNCFKLEYDFGDAVVYIYGKEFNVIFDDSLVKSEFRKLKDEIDFWRENERYLAHLLE